MMPTGEGVDQRQAARRAGREDGREVRLSGVVDDLFDEWPTSSAYRAARDLASFRCAEMATQRGYGSLALFASYLEAFNVGLDDPSDDDDTGLPWRIIYRPGAKRKKRIMTAPTEEEALERARELLQGGAAVGNVTVKRGRATWDRPGAAIREVSRSRTGFSVVSP